MQAFPKCDLLLDNDGQGSGVYLPELDEPEYCNPQNTSLWELHTLMVGHPTNTHTLLHAHKQPVTLSIWCYQLFKQCLHVKLCVYVIYLYIYIKRSNNVDRKYVLCPQWKTVCFILFNGCVFMCSSVITSPL